MNVLDRPRSPVYRQLEAYEESWKDDHLSAMACRGWEDAIAVGVNIFQMLLEREQVWRNQVFRGTIPFANDDNLDHQARFNDWLATTRQVLAATLPALEKRFGVVEGAEDLRRCADQAEKIVKQWQPPQLSPAVGLREMTLTQEAAAELDRLIAEAKQNPPATPTQPPMQEMSAAEFLARKRQSES